MDKGILVFGEDWHGLPSSTKHIVSEMLHEKKVIWINSIGLRKPKFTIKDIFRCFDKVLRAVLSKAKRPESVENENLTIVNPLTIPVPQSRIARFIAKKLLSLQIKRAIDKKGVEPDMLWMSLPTAVDVIDEFQELKSIYYCCDDFAGLAGVDHKLVSVREKELVKKADCIFATSDVLVEKLNRLPRVADIHYLPHGVSLDLFLLPKKKASDFPNADRKTCGFYGSISEWLDIELIAYAANALPSWDFIFIGKISANVDALLSLNNVYFLGEKTHQELPAYSQHWDVSMLPFKLTPQIIASNPLKLREYLAVGKSIVSTDFPAVRQYDELISIAASKNEFVEKIKQSMNSNDSKIAKQDAVLADSWKSTATKAAEWMVG